MRKMKKFSAGGAQGRYDRRMADIEKDYAKASKGKTGRAAEVAAAKRDQRIADAKDDLAKRTGADRTQTRAAEKAAERNLTMTRKFGAPKPAATPAKTSVSEPTKAPEAKPAAPEKKAEPKSFGEAFRAARASMGAGKTFTWQGKSYSTNRAGEGKAAPKAGAGKTPVASGTGKTPAATPTANTPAKPTITGAFSMLRDTPALSRQRMERARTEARRRNAESDTSKRFAESQKRKYGYAEGGTVKKKSMPPQPTPAERAASKRQDESLKKAKPTPADASAIGRGNRSSGMKSGGKVEMANKAGRALKKKSADTMGRAMMKKAGGGKCYAKGGSVSARADGCAVKGKTKGKMI